MSSATGSSAALPLATGRSLTGVMLVDSGTVSADQRPEPPIQPASEAEVLKAVDDPTLDPSASRTIKVPGVPL